MSIRMIRSNLFKKTLSNKRWSSLTWMNSSRYDNNILTIVISYGYQRYVSTIITLTQSCALNFVIQMANQMSQSFKTIRKRVSKFNNWMLVTFKEKIELKTVVSFLLLFIRVELIANFSSTSSPFPILFILSIAQLHTLIKQTTLFIKPFNHKLSLPLNSLHTKIKPCISTIRITLPI